MPNLQLQLLGHFHLLIDDAPVSIPQARLQSLLANLLLHRHTPHLRQQIAFTFWPESTETQARGNLRKALHDLRRLLPDLEQYLQGEAQNHKDVSIYLDVTAFEEQVAQAQEARPPAALQAVMEQAVLLYTGDLLPACYDDWVLSERERLRHHYLHLLEQLVYLLEERREYAKAAIHAQHLLQTDPLRESTYRALMRLHLQNGDRARALRVYHTCATLLQQELGVEPSTETQAAYRALLHLEAMPTTAPVVKSKLSLVGRRQEWSALQNGWRAAFQGQSHFALISGEAGIGKTRLAEALLQWAEQQGYTTARTRSYAAEGQLAYAPVADWLHAAGVRPHLVQLERVWLSEVARLLPEVLVERPDLAAPQPLTDSWQRQHFREALARALVVGKQPLMLLIDDLQWCDRETLEWLHYLLRFAATAQLLIVGTVRSEEIGPEHPLPTLLMNLRHDDKVIELELGPLDAAETAALAALIAGHGLNSGISASLYAETEGHPLFVVETVRARESGISSSLPAPVTELPPKVQAIIGSRLLQLTSATRELVGLAAVMGRAFSVAVLAHAGAIEDEALARALDELWQRRIIREHGESAYDFSHDRIREAAYAGISLPRRRWLHRRVAEALAHLYSTELDGVSGQIARHYELAALPEQAILFYQRAAEVAQQVYAYADAISILTKASALLNNLPSSTERLRQKLRLQLALGVSLMALKGNSAPELRELYKEAQEMAIQLGDDLEQIVAVAALHMIELTSGHIQEAYELSQYEIALTQRVSNPFPLMEAHAKLGMVMLHQGHWRASRDYLEPLIATVDYRWADSSRPTPFQHWGLSIRRHLAIVLWHLGYPDQALEAMDETLTLAMELAHPYNLANTLVWCAWVHYYRREVQLAQVQAERAVALSQQQGFRLWLAPAMATRGWTLAQQGQSKAGIACMEEALALRLSMDNKLRQPGYLAMLAESYGYAGELMSGLSLLDEAIAFVETTGERFSEADLYRLKAELLLMQGVGEQEAEACLLHSLAVARQQEAKSLELRTAMSLSRLWQQQDKRRQAYGLLAPIYDWFSEGFDTPDLKDARALLEALS